MKKKLQPVHNVENSGLPFKMCFFKSRAEEAEKTNESFHSHPYYEMVWLNEGQGSLFIETEEHRIEKNIIFCVKPNQMHCFQSITLAEGFVFSYSDCFFSMGEHESDWSGQSDLLQLFSYGPAIKISIELQEELKEIVLSMEKEYYGKYAFRSQILRRYFRILLIYFGRIIKENTFPSIQSRETKLVNSYLEMVERNFRTKKLVADYAEKLMVHPNYLNGIVKKNTGYPAGYHIRERVVFEAKRMSRYFDVGMKEIAFSLGFSDIGHFSKFFKSVCGINFSDFKKEGLNVSMFSSFNKIYQYEKKYHDSL
ncbi:MAG: helix-turn-helix transcriptional regulator [Bacteroidota bacterium]